MSSTIILRGFRVSVAVLDAFLAANGVDETNGTPPFYGHHPDKDPISVLLYTKIIKAGGTDDKNKFRVMIPWREGYNLVVAYVTYAWVSVYAHRELRLDKDLPEKVPTGFEELRMEILSFSDKISNDSPEIADEGRMGLFAVYTDGFRGLYTPQESIDRAKIPQYCDQCDAVFNHPYSAFKDKQQHLITVHGSRQARNPLVEA